MPLVCARRWGGPWAAIHAQRRHGPAHAELALLCTPGGGRKAEQGERASPCVCVSVGPEGCTGSTGAGRTGLGHTCGVGGQETESGKDLALASPCPPGAGIWGPPRGTGTSLWWVEELSSGFQQFAQDQASGSRTRPEPRLTAPELFPTARMGRRREEATLPGGGTAGRTHRPPAQPGPELCTGPLYS